MKRWYHSGGLVGLGVFSVILLFLDSRGVAGALAVISLLLSLSGIAFCLTKPRPSRERLRPKN